MRLVGLTGGIGAGKSTVAGLLQDRGAVVIDADELARRAVGPGSPSLVKVLDEFGDAVRRPDGSLDRAALAAVVFADERARRKLEAIVHPEVGRLLAEEIEPYRGTDRIVVYAVPLLVENRLEGLFDMVVTVEAPPDLRVERLARGRGMAPEAARARIAAQASSEERLRVADIVIRNDGPMEALEDRVDDLWKELVA